MKKYFSFIVAVATMFAVTSCSQEEVVGNENNDADYVSASFTVNTPEGMNSRAIGDGTTVNKVVCATFDAEGEEMTSLRQFLPLEDKQAQYSIRLVKGQNYRVAFFAYFDADGDDVPEYYDIKDLKNIKINDALSNIEGRDAFTAKYDIETGATMQPISETITLYRPFAQLNLGTYYYDWTAAVNAGVTASKTKIIVSNVYNTFSAFDDAVVGETSEMTFDLNTLPTEPLKADIDNNNQDEDYVYLALNYLLVGDVKNEKNLTDIKFVWETEDGKTNNPVTEYSNIPVQRNYRTNIIGWLLTNPAQFNIVIDERFEKPDYNIVAVDGTQAVGDIAKNTTDSYVDNGNREIAVIKNMHIKANETAIVVDEDFEAPSGTLLIANSTINAKLFMELNKYCTIIVRNCHLNVEQLLKITTGLTAYQIVFSNCYLNGEPMTADKKSEYFSADFLSLNTVNIYFNEGDEDNGGNVGGDDNQGGNDDNQGGEGNEGTEGGDDNQGGTTSSNVNMSTEMNNLGEVYNNQFFYIHDKNFGGTVTIDAKAYGDLYYFENVHFEDYIYIKESQTLFFDKCTFSKKGLVINQSGDTTVQIQVLGGCTVNGETINAKDIKGSGWLN